VPPSDLQSRGIYIHQLLEQFVKTKPEDPQEIIPNVTPPEYLAKNFKLQEQAQKAYLAAAKQLEKHYLSSWEAMMVEEQISIEDPPLKGVIDLLLRKNDKYLLLDYKTRNATSYNVMPINQQLAFYALLLQLRDGIQVKQGIIFEINVACLTITQKVFDLQFESMLDEILSQLQEMQNPKIYRNPTDNCAYECPWIDRCFETYKHRTERS